MAEFAINSSVNATTGYAPFELNYRYMLRLGQHISTNTAFKGVKQFAQQVLWNLIDAHDAVRGQPSGSPINFGINSETNSETNSEIISD